jgi:homoserine O-acetyltransferase
VASQYLLPDFVFASGERLPQLRLHTTTLGEPVRDAAGVVRNGILILHGTGGSGEAFLREQLLERSAA